MDRRIFLLPAILCFLGITYFSLIPKLDLPKVVVFNWSDKIAHFFAYFVLGALTSWGIKKQLWTFDNLKWFILTMIFSLYGLLLEIGQLIGTTSRQFDWGDAIANMMGMVVGIWVVKRVSDIY